MEFSAVVWHSSLSQANISDIERIQKSAMKVILKDQYKDYKSALSQLKLESLSKRREILCLKFAKKCLKLNKFKRMFPMNNKSHSMKQRKSKKFLENHANTDRYFKSSIPYMQSLLNKDNQLQKEFLINVNVNDNAYASELCPIKGSITIDNLN